MKKALSIFLCLLLCLPLIAGCIDTGTAENGTETTADTSECSESVSTADAPLLTGIKIAGNDISDYVIVKPEDASEIEVFAAEELAAYIEKSCGAKLEIVTETTSAKTISLIRDTSGELGKEGFIIKTEDGRVTITGGTLNGILFGVYEFIEEYIGWRYLTGGTEYLSACGTVEIADGIEDKQTPVMNFRGGSYAGQNTLGAGKDKTNCNENCTSANGYCHTFGYLTAGSHSAASQPCLSDETVYQTMLANVLKILAANPDADYINVSQDDNHGRCTCEKCLEIELEEGFDVEVEKEDGTVETVREGRAMGPVLRLVNRIAEAVYNAGYTKVRVQTLAYEYTEDVPSVTKPAKNVTIVMCLINNCYNHTMNDPDCNEFGGSYGAYFNNAERARRLEAWSAISEDIWVWYYPSDFVYLVPVYPCIHVMREDLRYLAENGVTGVFLCHEFGDREFAYLRTYLLSKLMWDPYMTEEEYQTHINDFLKGYYGSGWEEIRAYMDFTDESVSKSGNHMQTVNFHFAERNFVLKDYVLNEEELTAIFDRAARACTEAGETEAAQHVRTLRFSYDYIRLTCNYYANYKMGNEVIKAAWTEETKALYDELNQGGYLLMMAKPNQFIPGVPPILWMVNDIQWENIET